MTHESMHSIAVVADGAAEQVRVMTGMGEVVTRVVSGSGDAHAFANRGNRQAREASLLIGEGRDSIRDLLTSIQDVASNTTRIADIATAVATIARQIDMLSVNAAIEAERAGEHGRGFRAVAVEVSKLSERSALYVDEIAEIVDAVATQTDHAVNLSSEMGELMTSIDGGATQMVSIWDRVSSLVKGVTIELKSLETFTQRIFEVAEGSSSAAEQMASSSVEMSKLAKQARDELTPLALETR